VYLFQVGLLNSSIYSFTHKKMLRFGGYRLGCAGCASGSWSDLVRVICRDHCGSVCPDSFRNRMSYLIACCSHSGKKCFFGVEDHSDSVSFVFCNRLVLIVENFSLLAIGGVRREVCHGG
jgi:hypothetical protein